jgi:hypothetical protein
LFTRSNPLSGLLRWAPRVGRYPISGLDVLTAYRRGHPRRYPADVVVSALDVIANYRTCEFTTLFRDGSPQTWPVSPLLLDDGRFFVATSIGLPQKAFNIRRNPRVSMLFSEPTGSGITEPAAVLIQGDATAEDRIVADVTTVPELTRAVETISRRQPAGAVMNSRIGRRLFPSYYVRILIYVSPRRALFWPTRDFTRGPEVLDLAVLRRVG